MLIPVTTMTVTTARVHRYHLGFRLIHTVYRLMPMATAIGSNRPSGAGVCLTSTKPNFNNRNTKRSVSISRKHDLLYRENAHIFVSLSFFLFTGSHCFCYGSTSSPGDCLYYTSFVLPSLFLSKILTHFVFLSLPYFWIITRNYCTVILSQLIIGIGCTVPDSLFCSNCIPIFVKPEVPQTDIRLLLLLLFCAVCVFNSHLLRPCSLFRICNADDNLLSVDIFFSFFSNYK
jgi:hypothetical protein